MLRPPEEFLGHIAKRMTGERERERDIGWFDFGSAYCVGFSGVSVLMFCFDATLNRCAG